MKCVLRKLRNGKSPGPDGTPPDYWKALSYNEEALQQITDFANICWVTKRTPVEWHTALVTAIHKKGRTDACENYRPISLLNIGYKVFAALLHSRLVSGGAEERLTQSQYGFRSGYSTQDAIFVLRRKIEAARAQRNGRLSALALDWKMAFDSVDPAAMIVGLRRFGLPEHFLDVIKSIYAERSFKVRDCGYTSASRPQAAGISQGCPLSPLLFVVIMSVVMQDALGQLQLADQLFLERGDLAALLYADDTLLLGSNASSVERYLLAVGEAGRNFGLQLHADKFQLLQIGKDGRIHTSNGTAIEARESMVYLGALITTDGRIQPELARRGAAHTDFRALSKVWTHAALSRAPKVQLLKATIQAKLAYGLATAWLNAAERRRLDGFYIRCLRKIWDIKPAFISRTSNAAVLLHARERPITEFLQKQQVALFRRVAAAPEGCLLRDATFCKGSLRPFTDMYVRRRGRPNLEWASEVTKILHLH